MRPASEKRQGTKSRWVGHPALERALWGFGRVAEDLGWCFPTCAGNAAVLGLSQPGAGLQAGQEAGEGRFRAECLGVTDFCFLWDFSVHTRKAVTKEP
jgi:hypothetical protein